MAASVSTRVVSWNDAAEMNESVDSEALVMPSSTSACVAGACPRHAARRWCPAAPERSTCSPGCRPNRRVGDLDAAQHLANDHLDVLVVDLHALQTVDVLDFVDDVARQLLDAEQAQDVLRVGRRRRRSARRVDHLAFVHQDVLFGPRAPVPREPCRPGR